MKLKELIEALQGFYDQVEGDYDAKTAEETEVRLAFQPNWPFEHSLGEVEMCDRADYEDEDDAPDSDDPQIIVYLGEGNQIGYLPGHAKKQLGW